MEKIIKNSPMQFFPDEPVKKLDAGASDDLLNAHFANQDSQATHDQSSKKYFLKTMGCQMNVADSGFFAKILSDAGFQPTDDLSTSNIALINTCSVRQHAEDKVYALLGSLRRWKEKNPDNILIVAGCVAQQTGEHLKKRFPQVDLVIGAKDIKHFPEALSQLGPFSRLSNLSTYQPINLSTKVTAFVPIIRGCENYCSYCIVPYVRGKEISRPLEEVISEINCRVEQGIKEVTLLGQNVNSYKSCGLPVTSYQGTTNRLSNLQHETADLKRETGFAQLLEKVNRISGLERIRFVTSHPKDLDESIIYAIRDLEKVCEHLHLPVQAGSNKILERMNRKYSREDYLALAEKIKKNIPEIAITTDIIVGFPGETEEDFTQTLDLVNCVGFDSAYTFKYSPRSGTNAAKLENDIPQEVKEERLSRLNALCKNISEKKNHDLIGTRQEVLLEKYISDRLEGRTRTNKIVFLDSPSATVKGENKLIGKVIKVGITQAHPHSLIGKIQRTTNNRE